MKKALIFGILSPILAIVLALGRAYYHYDVWQYPGEDIVLEISPGEGFSSINGKLVRQGIISSGRVFHRACQFQGVMQKFRAGQFKIMGGSTMKEVLDTLLFGKPITTAVTIPEGKNLYEIAKILENSLVIERASDFISLAKNKDFIKNLGIHGDNAEGYLYPETYNFTPNQKAEAIIRAMVDQFKNKTKNLSLKKEHLTPYEIITLASIVEKETGAKHERPMIAGVFFNRLHKKMRLQSDPTTIYGIWESYKGNLKKDHLLQVTPYNTYKIPALPVGPICNPGLEAIKAVLNPESHSYLYFVSQNDGTHIFTKTYEDHKKAVEDYQINRKNREGKSWRDLSKKENSKAL